MNKYKGWYFYLLLDGKDSRWIIQDQEDGSGWKFFLRKSRFSIKQAFDYVFEEISIYGREERLLPSN